MKKMWFTKYAFSDGVQESEVQPSMYQGYLKLVGSPVSYKVGKHLHETKELAEKAVESERVKKIKSLEKQIARLKDLKVDYKAME